MKTLLKLAKHEYIVTAFASPSYCGPSTPITVIIARGASKEMRVVWIQREDQTDEMRAIYPFSAASHSQMTTAVKATVKGTK